MFGLDVDSIELQPVYMDDEVWVPIHVETDDVTTTTYRPYSELGFEDGERLGTDDYRYDP